MNINKMQRRLAQDRDRMSASSNSYRYISLCSISLCFISFFLFLYSFSPDFVSTERLSQINELQLQHASIKKSHNAIQSSMEEKINEEIKDLKTKSAISDNYQKQIKSITGLLTLISIPLSIFLHKRWIYYKLILFYLDATIDYMCSITKNSNSSKKEIKKIDDLTIEATSFQKRNTVDISEKDIELLYVIIFKIRKLIENGKDSPDIERYISLLSGNSNYAKSESILTKQENVNLLLDNNQNTTQSLG